MFIFSIVFGAAFNATAALMGGAIQGAPSVPINVEPAIVSTLSGSAAGLVWPAIPTDGTNLYVVDTLNYTIHRIVIGTGEDTIIAGTGTWGSEDGIGTAASFNTPFDSVIGSVAAGVGKFVDNSASIGTTYFYMVRATDGTKESADSNEGSAASIRNLPSSPTNLVASDTPYDLGGSITLNWTKSVDDGAGPNNVTGYNLYRYSASNGTITLVVSLPAGTTTYVDGTTLDTDTYYYFIKASDSHCGAESAASTIASGRSFRNLPMPPSGVTASDVQCDNGGATSINRTRSVDDGAGLNNVGSYNIYRASSAGGSYVVIGSVLSGISGYRDANAQTGTLYYYMVRATDGTRESSNSNVSSAASSRNLPLAPANLTAADTLYDLGGSITLTRTKSVDDGAGLNNVSGYNVYRYSITNGTIVSLASLPAGATSFVDNATLDSDTYYYFVKALGSPCDLESGASNTASGQSINNLTALSGFIGNQPGISQEQINSLTSTVDNAISSYYAGNQTAAINTLNALLNEVNAQTGKCIEPSASETIVIYVQNLINYITTY